MFLRMTFRICAATVVLVLSASHFAQGLKLNSNGGYEISIAISEGSTSRDESYIATIQAIFSRLSLQLFWATKGTFFIQNVDIIVPNSWTSGPTPVKTDALATTESFESSDIRVSDTYTVPYVENPNICGRPGQFMQFPTDFFSTKNDGKYGKAWKALLNQWARYRWGVWEEHGLPGDSKFPYFHKVSPLSANWSTTGCSDVEIKGKFVDRWGETNNDICNPANGEKEMDLECRFKASLSGNTATTSLMHFHSIESVTDFCDETTHNQDAPNKQNLFCGYKSVWEVIRETLDFAAVTPISDGSIPAVQFKTVAVNGNPILYILLDKGQSNLPAVVQKLNAKIATLFDSMDIDVQNVLTSLGTFPSRTGEKYVEERVSWSPMSSAKAALIVAVNEPAANDAPVDRDFGLAILEAVETIKLRNPPGGAILLIVKTGAGKGNFGSLTYEEEVRGTLQNGQIKLVTAEIQVSPSEPYVNLKSLTDATAGDHTRVTSSNIDSTIVQEMIARLQGFLKVVVPKTGSSVLIHKGLVPVNTVIPVYLRSNLAEMNFSLTLPANAEVYITAPEGSYIGLSTPEWDETTDPARRKLMRGYAIIAGDDYTNGRIWNIKYECRSNCAGISAQLNVYGVIPDTPEVETLDVVAYTSAVDNVADFNETRESDTPFSIFARATQRDAPVSNLTVEAVIRRSGSDAESWVVPMTDDGLGSPDLTKDDGIYSGTFIPPDNGFFRIMIRLVNDQIRPVNPPPPMARLLPDDQNDLVCATSDCKPISLTKYLQTTVDMPAPVSCINRELFTTGKPVKISDLMLTFDVFAGIRVQFTSPKLVGAEPATGVQYYIYVSTSRELLLGNLSMPNPEIELRMKDANESGVIESFILGTNLVADVIYVVIQTINGNHKSELSNIPSVQVDDMFTGPTTVTTEIPSTVSADPPSTIPPVDPTTTEAPGTGTAGTGPPTVTTEKASTVSADPPSTISPVDPPSTISPVDPPSTISPVDPPSTISPVDPPSTISQVDPTTTETPGTGTAGTGPPTVTTEIASTVSADPPSTISPVDPTSTEGRGTGIPETTEPNTEEDEPFFESTWGIVVIVIIVLVVLLTGVGIFYYCYRDRGCYHTEKESARASRVGSPERQRPDSYA